MADPHMIAYASWRVAGGRGEHIHNVHGGEVKATANAPVRTLDDVVREYHVPRLDVIKIDTDGYEWEVLQGARETLRQFRPSVIFEVGQYTIKEHGASFEKIAQYFNELGYGLYTSHGGEIVSVDNWKWYVPKFGTIDIIAQPLVVSMRSEVTQG